MLLNVLERNTCQVNQLASTDIRIVLNMRIYSLCSIRNPIRHPIRHPFRHPYTEMSPSKIAKSALLRSMYFAAQSKRMYRFIAITFSLLSAAKIQLFRHTAKSLPVIFSSVMVNERQ